MERITQFIFMFVYLSQGKTREMITQDKNPFIITTIENSPACINKGDRVTLRCTLTAHNFKDTLNNWTLSWYYDNKYIAGNVTEFGKNSSHSKTTHLTVKVEWPTRKKFTCVGKQMASNTEADSQLNASSIVKVQPHPINLTITGIRFVQLIAHYTVEVYWRPLQLGKNIQYNLKYCREKNDDDLTEVCRHYYKVNSRCLYLHKDVYNVPNTKGYICKSTIPWNRVVIHKLYRLYVTGHMKGEMCKIAHSSERKIELAFFKYPLLPEDNPLLVLIPHAVVNLQAHAPKPRAVTLNWSDPKTRMPPFPDRTYTVSFTCFDAPPEVKIVTTKRRIDLMVKDYEPYKLCRFCVTNTLYSYGLDSEPSCKHFRLNEEPPRAAPNIDCPEDKCKSVRNEKERNITITWILPPKKYWNGVLTKVKVFYSIEHGHLTTNFSKQTKSIEVPIRSNTTRGESVLTGLAVNESYSIQLAACNSKGCSNPGTPFILLAEVAPTPTEIKTSSIMNKVLIPLAGIAGLIVTAYLVCWGYNWKRTRKDIKLDFKLNIREPINYEEVIDRSDKPDQLDQLEYDVLADSKETYV